MTEVEQAVFTAVPLVFAGLHALFFAFQPSKRESLYFAVLAAAFAIAANRELAVAIEGARYSTSLQRTAVLVLLIASAGFHFAVHRSRAPTSLVFLAIATGALVVVGWVWPFLWFWMIQGVGLGVIIIIVRSGLRSDFDEARMILRAGLFLALLGGALDLLMDTQGIPTILGTENPWLYGFLCLLIAMALYDAYTSSATNRSLELRLAEVQELSAQVLSQERASREQEIRSRLLEASNERQSQELEEARALQLSMLPRELPQGTDWDIAVSMQTATEVGGDYYDVDIDQHGTLTVAVGDAVGHGARAGALVAATKSLFVTNARNPDLASTLTVFDQALGRLATDRLFVALLLARFQRGTIEVASAAMPPALHYRKAADEVRELGHGGLPLGSPLTKSYTACTAPLQPGDSVLLMSDGFPELPDGDGIELGYSGVLAAFEQVAHLSAAKAIDGLRDVVISRCGDQAPPDDVALAVVRFAPELDSFGA